MANINPVPGEWSSPFVGCCAAPGGCGLCAAVSCCSCLVYGDAVAKAGPDSFFCGACGNMSGDARFILGTLAFLPLTFCATGMTRHAVREKHHIAGHPIVDYLLAFLCPCCALCQLHNEVVIRKRAELTDLQKAGGTTNAPQVQTAEK